MKKLKILFAVITVLSLLFTVASATSDSYLRFDADTVEYTEGSELTISVYASKAISYAAGYSFEMTFDNTVWNYKSAAFNTSIASDGMVSGEDGTGRADAISIVITTGGNKEIAADTKIVDLTFEKVAGEAAGTKFVLDFDVFGGNFMTPAGEVMNFSGEIEVVAAAQDETVHGSATAATKTELVVGDTFYKNIAIFDNAITLDAEKTAKKVGWTLKSSDEAKADKVIEYTLPTAISGGGTVQFAGIVYNIPAEVTVTAVPFVVYGN